MEQNIVEIHMDEHLTNIERVVKMALDRFQECDIKLDSKFMKHFLNMTTDRLIQTCDRYNAEAKWTVQLKQPNSNPSTSLMAQAVQMNDLSADIVENDTVEMAKADKQMSNEPNSNGGTKNDIVVKSYQGSLIFYCAYCFDENNFRKSFCGTIAEVYDHWHAKYANELISKPFKFYAFTLLSCIHCNEIGIYDDLVQHHQDQHEGQQFAIVNPKNLKECGICHSTDNNLLEHFKIKHNLNTIPKIFNPIYMSEEKIAKLLTIQMHGQHRCGNCSQIFKTIDETAKHYAQSHCGRAIDSTESMDYQNMPSYLVCGFCHDKVNYNEFLSHFCKHSYSFHCSQCHYQIEDISDIIYHEKSVHKIDSLNYHFSIFPGWIKNKFFNTNVVFSNGLTLKIYNMVGTKYDDSKLFEDFIYELLDVKRERAKLMIELNELSSVPKTEKMETDETTDMSSSSNYSTPEKWNVDSIDQIKLSLKAELIKQQKLAKNVYVHGIFEKLKIPNLYDVFMKLCRKLKLSVTRSSIKEIIQCEDGIIVKFYRMNTKKLVLSRTSNSSYVWSNDLLKSSKGYDKVSWKIFIRNHMTPFYTEICIVAAGLKRQNILHSYKLSEHGLVVKQKPDSNEQIVLSEQQLLEYVGKN